MDYLDENIYMLTSLIQSGIQEYIYVETTNFDNVRAGLDAQNARTFTICSLISLAAIIVSVLLTVNASRSVTRPIQKLCSVTQKVAEGDFTIKTKVENTDEIAVLTQSFNDMTQEIGILVEDIKKKAGEISILRRPSCFRRRLTRISSIILWIRSSGLRKKIKRKKSYPWLRRCLNSSVRR